MGDSFQRSGFLNVSSEKSDNGTGAYDGQGEPDDASEWPAETIFFPHGDERQGNENYGQEYDQQKT